MAKSIGWARATGDLRSRWQAGLCRPGPCGSEIQKLRYAPDRSRDWQAFPGSPALQDVSWPPRSITTRIASALRRRSVFDARRTDWSLRDLLRRPLRRPITAGPFPIFRLAVTMRPRFRRHTACRHCLKQKLNGNGQNIVIVDAYGDDTIASDANAFSQINGLPALTSNNFGSSIRPVPPIAVTTPAAGMWKPLLT